LEKLIVTSATMIKAWLRVNFHVVKPNFVKIKKHYTK